MFDSTETAVLCFDARRLIAEANEARTEARITAVRNAITRTIAALNLRAPVSIEADFIAGEHHNSATEQELADRIWEATGGNDQDIASIVAWLETKTVSPVETETAAA